MRLTKDMKKIILEKIIKHTFNKKEKALNLRAVKLGDMIYNEIVTKEQRDLMAKRPSHFFNSYSKVKANTKDYRYSYQYFYLSEKKPFPASNDVWLWDGQSKIAKRIQHFMAAEARLETDTKQSAVEIMGVLSQANTAKQLLEIWPEIEEFIPVNDKNNYPVPALKMDDLNKKLNLKRGKAK